MTLASRMSSEKVAVTLTAGPTSPPLRGKVLMTLGAVESGSSSSKEPMSQTGVASASPSWGLVTPRWSVSGGGQEVEGGPLSMAGLSVSSAWVIVGPPLSARSPSLGSLTPVVSPARLFCHLGLSNDTQGRRDPGLPVCLADWCRCVLRNTATQCSWHILVAAYLLAGSLWHGVLEA